MRKIKYLKFIKPCNKITDYIYLGNIDDANNKDLLKKLNIKNILNVTKEIPNFHPKNFNYKQFNIQDNPNFDYFPYFDQIADFINYSVVNKQKIWVHCYCGISRSTSAIIAYYIKYKCLPIPQIIDNIKSKRPFINPNKGFLKQLNKFKKIVFNPNIHIEKHYKSINQSVKKFLPKSKKFKNFSIIKIKDKNNNLRQRINIKENIFKISTKNYFY